MAHLSSGCGRATGALTLASSSISCAEVAVVNPARRLARRPLVDGASSKRLVASDHVLHNRNGLIAKRSDRACRSLLRSIRNCLGGRSDSGRCGHYHRRHGSSIELGQHMLGQGRLTSLASKCELLSVAPARMHHLDLARLAMESLVVALGGELLAELISLRDLLGSRSCVPLRCERLVGFR